MNNSPIRKLTKAGLLGLGLLGLAMPALADTPVSSFFITRNLAVGTTQSPNLGPVAGVQCALTQVRSASSTAQATECRLVNVGGQWRLNATILAGGASVTCGVHCYQ